jgi:hypothetical protein
MKARMNNPVMILPEALQALHALKAAADKGSVPAKTVDLVEMRASQITVAALLSTVTPAS